MSKLLIIKGADFADYAIVDNRPVMTAYRGWIGSTGLSDKAGTPAFYGVVPVEPGDTIYIEKTSGTKAFWVCQLSDYTHPTTNGVSLDYIAMSIGGTSYARPSSNELGNPTTFLVAETAQFLAVSIFANDGNESTQGNNSPTKLTINGVNIVIPQSL